MNLLSKLFGGSTAPQPSNDTCAEEMEEMIFDDPEGDDYLIDDTGEDPAIDPYRAMDNLPPEEPKGFFARLFG
jgi:hypothetical protein